MTAIADFTAEVQNRTKDGAAFLAAADYTSAITQALVEYSKHRARVLVADLAGAGSYDLVLPVTWETDFSEVRSVEYPAGEQDPAYLQPADYLLYSTAVATKLRLRYDTPAVGETVRISYSATHTIAATSTVPASDNSALADLAASFCLRKLASRQTQSSDTTIGADAVNYGQQPTNYTMLADRLLRQYRDHMGLGDGGQGGSDNAPALTIRDTDTDMAWGGERLTHPRRWY